MTDTEQAKVERVENDARRYQWLRDTSCPPHHFCISVPEEFAGVKYAASDVDAYIDAAIAAMETDDGSE